MAETIGNWDVSQLIKFIRDILDNQSTQSYQQLTAEDLVATKFLRVKDKIVFEASKHNWRKVGGTGEPAFANSWVNWGSPYHSAQFRKDPFGVVHLRGIIKTGTVGNVAFTLPPGMRPLNEEILDCISNNAIGRIDIQADGDVIPMSPSNNTWVSLSGLYFHTD